MACLWSIHEEEKRHRGKEEKRKLPTIIYHLSITYYQQSTPNSQLYSSLLPLAFINCIGIRCFSSNLGSGREMTLLQRTIYGVCTKYLPSIHLVSIHFTRSRKGAKRQRRKEEKKKRSKEAKMQRSKEAKKKNNNNYQLPNPIINFSRRATKTQRKHTTIKKISASSL